MNERISNVLQSPFTIPVATGVVGFVAGVGAGYILARRNKSVDIHELPAQLELDLEAGSYEEDVLVLDVVPGQLIIQEETEVLTTIELVEEELDEPVHAETSFAADDEDWDYEKELEGRRGDIPYIIHEDEFHADEFSFTQSCLTYYVLDDILVDEDSTPIYNHSSMVGALRFGHGSNDPDIVFVRNQKMRSEYEIVRDPGAYSVEVLGLEIENNARINDIKHANSPRRFRSD